MSNIHYVSNSYLIGKTTWRFVVFQEECEYSKGERKHAMQFLEQEPFSREIRWLSYTKFKGYNLNDGTFAGCPRRLAKIFEQEVRPRIKINGNLDNQMSLF